MVRQVVLHVPTAVAVERCYFRRIDPETGRTYHLLHDPPGTNATKATAYPRRWPPRRRRRRPSRLTPHASLRASRCVLARCHH